MLIKSIPASNGMSCPKLFQQVKANISGIVTIVIFQKQDEELVKIRPLFKKGKISWHICGITRYSYLLI
jgi:hypothetical protein